MFLPLNDRQFEFWRLHRSGILSIDIARLFNISKQAVSKALITMAIIFVSAKHGMQVWYKHEGNCGACTRYAQCIELLWDFADEMKVKLEKTEDPTKLADGLFE